jgi:hypothetical protein
VAGQIFAVEMDVAHYCKKLDIKGFWSDRGIYLAGGQVDAGGLVPDPENRRVVYKSPFEYQTTLLIDLWEDPERPVAQIALFGRFPPHGDVRGCTRRFFTACAITP